ncbi:MAG: helix-turn-helix domain-containing protein [Carboxylicivirga sp.]|jgi:AraC-like DNA-binding protein|nr:helix-turn-helix domain-containing protein [Carboxylicivirga sp.]MCT4644316.1 helix-turn-helix domain-containing protein [Carboxylicivirga sp.]
MQEYTIQLDLNIFSIADIFSFTTAFMLALLFVATKSENKRANIYLGLCLFSLSIEVLSVLMEQYLELDCWIMQSSMFTMPLLLMYVQQTINLKRGKHMFWLFLPGVLFNIIGESLQLFEYLFNIAILVFILRLLKKHQKSVRSYYSNLEQLTLKWIKVIVLIFLGFHVLWITEDLVVIQADWLGEYFAGISSMFTLFMIFWIGHNGFSQHEIFTQKMFACCEEKIPEESEEQSFNDIENNDNQLWVEIRNKIQTKQLFLDPKLNLRGLSEAIGMNEKEVSRLINQQENCNFYQFINRYRVEQFKKLLVSERATQLSFMGLAYEAGFNSKSTFYSAFKAIEGITPKQFKDSIQKSG